MKSSGKIIANDNVGLDIMLTSHLVVLLPTEVFGALCCIVSPSIYPPKDYLYDAVFVTVVAVGAAPNGEAAFAATGSS